MSLTWIVPPLLCPRARLWSSWLNRLGLDRLNEAAVDGDVDRAEREFETLIPQVPLEKSTVVYNTLLKAFANHGSSQKAAWLYGQMRARSVRVNARTYGKIIEAYAKSGDLESAMAWMSRRSQDFKADSVVVNMLLDAAAQAGRAEEAEVLFFAAKKMGFAATPHSFGSVLHSLAKAGKSTEAIAWLERMDMEQVEPNAICYGAVIDACAKSGQPNAAVMVFQQMQLRKLQPDLVVFGGIVHAFSQLGQVADAALWLKEAEASKLKPNLIIYNSIISASARAGNPKQAIRWLQQMQAASLRPNPTSYTGVLDAFSKKKDVSLQEVTHWFHQMVNDQHSPDEAAFSCVIFCCAKARRPKEAEAWLRRMHEAELKPDSRSFNGAIASAAQLGQMDLAVTFLRYTNIISACAKTSNRHGAMHWLQEMREAALPPNVLSYTCAIEACLRPGPDVQEGWADALSLLRRMRQVSRQTGSCWASCDALLVRRRKRNFFVQRLDCLIGSAIPIFSLRNGLMDLRFQNHTR
ncbi:unnamed protein product [Symbiodinium microadriaticum]|nr:unnamed protein product [Symbiodinium microadriaticum]